MRKLEEILSAEEAARHALTDASERANALVRDASGEARGLIEMSRASALETAAGVRASILEAADVQVSEVRVNAAAALSAHLEKARARMDTVVARTVRELVG